MSEEMREYPGAAAVSGLPDRKQVIEWFKLIKNPLVREQAVKFWGCRRHIANMESPASLITNLNVWMNDYGLEPEDANLILIQMLAPGKMANHQFASQLMSALDAEVAAILKRRKEEKFANDLKAEELARSKVKK